MNTLRERLQAVRAAMDEAALRSGRKPDDIELVAVSKGNPPEAIAEAIAAGQTLFGESRVQEARPKIAAAGAGTRWHFIGHLQKNKIRQALPIFEAVQSVDSLDLAKDLNRVALELGLRSRILLEVNIGGETSKHGFQLELLPREIGEILNLPALRLDGLMAIPPYAEDPENSRPYFIQLRTLRDRLAEEFSVSLPALSMGMSNDFAVAIEEGATLVRVGTALFGERRQA